MSENDLVGNLTVGEFRKLMQQCFDADRAEQVAKQQRQFAVTQLIMQGMGYQEAERKVAEESWRGR